jgi:DNA primase
MISFDADSAGQKAALRGLDLAWQQGMNVKVIKLQAGKDPAECLEKDKGLWLQSIKGAVNIIDYYFESVLRDLDLNRSDHKKKAAASLLPIIARLPDAIDRTHYLQKLGHILGVDDKVLADKINALKPKVATVTAVPVSSGQSVNSREITVLLGERILALLLSHPEKISLIINELLPEDFVDSNFQNIYKELNIYYTKGNLHDLDRTTAQQHVLGLWDDKKDLLPIVNTLSLLASKDFHALTDREIERELEQLVKRFKKENIQLRVKKLSEALAQAEAKGEVARVEELTAQLDQEIINLS